MAVRELNSPEQLMHLNPSACGAFAFAGALPPVRDTGMRKPVVVFTMQFKFKLRVNCSAIMVVCCDSLHPTTKSERNKKVPTNVNSLQCMVACNSFAMQARLNHDWNHDCNGRVNLMVNLKNDLFNGWIIHFIECLESQS
jgi:hypothetical protein